MAGKNLGWFTVNEHGSGRIALDRPSRGEGERGAGRLRPRALRAPQVRGSPRLRQLLPRSAEAAGRLGRGHGARPRQLPPAGPEAPRRACSTTDRVGSAAFSDAVHAQALLPEIDLAAPAHGRHSGSRARRDLRFRVDRRTCVRYGVGLPLSELRLPSDPSSASRKEEPMAEPIERSTPSERVATLMAQPHGDLSDAAEQLAALVAAASAELLDVICADRSQGELARRRRHLHHRLGGRMLRVSYATAKEWVRVGARPRPAPARPRGVLRGDALVGPGPPRHRVRHPRRRRGRRARPARPHRRPDRADGQVLTGAARRATPRAPSTTGCSPGARTATPTASATAASSPPRRAPSSTPPSSSGPSGSARTRSPACGTPRSARCADALVDICRNDVLDHPGPDPTVVVVHVDADVVDGTVEGNGSIDGIPVPVDSVRRLLCDCEIEYSIDGPDGTCIGIGRAGRNPPRWLRRRLDHRDGTCRFGGCGRGSATSTTSSTGPRTVPPTPTTSSASAGTTTTSSTKAAGPSRATPTTS